jgi:hypothetical protein
MEFTQRKPSLAPRVDRGETRVDVGDVIVDPDGMANTQGPQGRIMINSRNWSRISVDNSAASLLPGLWVGPMFSPCSDLLE